MSFLAAQETLGQGEIEFEFQDHKIVHSIYFYYPEGHLIERTTYELSDASKDELGLWNWKCFFKGIFRSFVAFIN